VSLSLVLYNSLGRRLERFVPPDDRPVRLYVCGVTPYDTTHIGHAATYAAFDVLVRFLEHQGQRVQYVQNVTDIDDDILRKADQLGEDWRRLGNRWTAHFIGDMIALNVRPPEAYVRATDGVADILAAVEGLLAAGAAYVADGSVYFSVAADPDFGKLSQVPPGERLALANERGNRPDEPGKRDPLDFVLWQAAAPGEPTWDSPWGRGRPGWHIECSSLIARWLGPQIEIHGGGGDLIFPHHECEIAQAECAGGPQPFVRIWMHVAMVAYQGEKMSKSLGNLVMARDVLQRFSANALRVYLAMHHYREPWEFEWAGLDAAAALADRLEQAVQRPASMGGTPAGGPDSRLDSRAPEAEFLAALADDLNTPRALAILDGFAAQIAHQLAGGGVDEAQACLAALASVLGLRLNGHGPAPEVERGWEQHLRQFEPV
jgi:L-cysteine:1D-myo-inositol 2-amino-2-deoxy-alpha-D-glucopyranoside ligase